MKSTSLALGRVRDVGEERAFFISANGYDGFRTRQDALYRSENFDRIFIILGGPGTGKSSLMRTVAEAADQVGAEIEYIYCSSDPASLDGVIISKGAHRVALLDGTAPHERGASVPGAIDEIVHLGTCWDTDLLIKSKSRIQGEQKAGETAFARARSYLSLAGEVSRALSLELDRIIEREKLEAAVTRELRSVHVTNRPYEEVRYLSACGAGGVVRLNTFAKECEVVCISNEYGAAHRYLNVLLSRLRSEGVYGYWRFPSCYDDKITESIYLPQNKRLYLVDNGESCTRKINIKRFVNKEKEVAGRAHIRRLLHLRNEMTHAACLCFGEASARHFALEKIYGEAMDFGKKSAIAHLITKKVFALLNPSRKD